MEAVLNAQVRELTNRGAVRRLRRQDKVPAVLYGPKTDPVNLAVETRQLEKLIRDMGEESHLVRLVIDGGKGPQTRQVLIREIQVHPVKRRFLHVDFYEVPLDQALEFDVPIELVGEAIGVKKGGALELVRRHLSVRCLPGEIPDKVTIDIADFDIGTSVHVSDLIGTVPYELADDPSYGVLYISHPEGAEEDKGSGE